VGASVNVSGVLLTAEACTTTIDFSSLAD